MTNPQTTQQTQSKSIASWKCKCGAKGRNQEHPDRQTALSMVASLGFHHPVFYGAPGTHEVTVTVDSDTYTLKQAAALALGLSDLTFEAVLEKAGSQENVAVHIPQVAPAVPRATGLPPYHAHNGEVQDVLEALAHGFNVLFIGPTGCGKTHLAQHVVGQAGKEMVTIQGTDGATYEDLVGYRTIEGGNVRFVDGLIVRAMRAGHVLYVDEPNALPDGIRFALFSAMDHRRELTLAQNDGEVVKAAPGFTVLAAMNEGTGYGGTTMLNQAFRARFDMVLTLDYLDGAEEARLLTERTGLDKKTAKKMVEVASKLRQALKARQVRTPVSTRSLLAWARLVASGKDAQKAARLTVIGQVPTTDPTEAKVFGDTVEAVMGSKVADPSKDA